MDQETGERGYIITGDPDFLAPYAAAWDDRLGRLTRHLEENP